MLAKVGKGGKGFGGKIDYLFDGKLEKRKNEDKQAELITWSDNMRVPNGATDKEGRKLMKNCFINHAKTHDKYGDGKTEFVKEHILSFTKYDKSTLNPERLKAICDAYIKDAGIDKTQYVAISHNDTKNFHVHILFNNVQNDGTLYAVWKEKIKTAERGVSTSLQFDLEITGEQAKFVKTPGVMENRLNHDDIKKIANQELISEARNLKHLEKLCEAKGIPFNDEKEYVKVNHKTYKRIDLEAVFYKNRKPKIKEPGTYKKGEIRKKIYSQQVKPKKDFEIKKEKVQSTEKTNQNLPIVHNQVNSGTGRRPWSKEDDEDIIKRKKRKGRGL